MYHVACAKYNTLPLFLNSALSTLGSWCHLAVVDGTVMHGSTAMCGTPYTASNLSEQLDLNWRGNCLHQEENEQQASSAAAAADMQAEMLVTQQAFHAKQTQYEGASALSVVILFQSLQYFSVFSLFDFSALQAVQPIFQKRKTFSHGRAWESCDANVHAKGATCM